MTSELRIIRFKMNEVETALRALAPHIELELPGGEFVSAANDKGQESPSTSFIVGEGSDSFSVSNGKLAASLILHYKKSDIPLPREGNKEIYASEKFIELRIGIRHQTIAQDHGRPVQIEA